MNHKTKNTVKRNNSSNSNNIKLSIVVPCCNVEKYLDQCLTSIVNQTLKEIEIICINDGSKDSTLSIIQNYARKDKRIVVIDKPNSGYGDSMNKGFAAAKGKYIGIVESDDFIEPEMFKTLYETAEKNNADVVKSNFWFYWSSPERNELHEYFRESECDKVIKPSEYDNGSLFGRKPSIWSAIYKKEFLNKNNISFLPTPGASFQDTSFTFKVYSSAQRMVCLYQPFLHYRQDNENSSVNNADKKAFCVCDEYKEIEKFINNKSGDDKARLYAIYGAAFYDTCIWMYERCGVKMRYTFLKKISPWLKRIVDEIGVENLNFGDAWWKSRDIVRIANNPFEYHMWRDVERYEQIGSTFVHEKAITPLDNVALVKSKQKKKATSPFFSIIVPVYNNEKFIYTCLDSLLFQSFNDYEIICINDGSSDNSLSILEEYAKIDDRIVIINQSNCGPAAARNAGIDVAVGKYILFLDSDDYYSENACDRIHKELLSSQKPQAVIFGTGIFPDDPRASDWHYYVLTTPDKTYDKVDQKTILTTPYLKIYSWRCCFEREFLNKNKIKFNSGFKYGEDALFMYEAMPKIKGISVISDKLYNYRHFNSNSLMNSISRDPIEYAKQQQRILGEMIRLSKKNGFVASPELMEFYCDFIYSSIANCPEPEKIKNIIEFVKKIKKCRLDRFTNSVSDNCRGFWNYCVDVRKNSSKATKVSQKVKWGIKKIIPPSRVAFYDYAFRFTDSFERQQNSINSLQRQITEMHRKNDMQTQLLNEQKWLLKELLKKYDDDRLWQLHELIDDKNIEEDENE